MLSNYTSNDEVWDNWINEQTDMNANDLIENYMYLVHYHVQRIVVNLPKSVEREDIKSLGLYGLYDAIRKFDHQRDLKFDTYASFRIKGAILDGLRKEDWLPRSTRDKVKKIEKVTEELEQQLQREVSSEEVAHQLGIEKDEVEETVKDSFFANLLSMEEKSNDTNDDQREGIGYLIPDHHALTPEEKMIQHEDYGELSASISKLNTNEQMVLSLFYDKELTFTEIGKVLELTTSRISQIHKQAIYKTRQLMMQEKK